MAYEHFVTEGRVDERLAARSILHALGGRMAWATEREDVEDHVDLWWTRRCGSDGSTLRCGIDVKGMRKLSRGDAEPSNDITWLETRNVHGKPGSLYGKATYIAFIRIGKVLVVDRRKLLSFALAKIEGKPVVVDRPNACYVPYSRIRWGRDDITFMARLDDIEAIAEFVVPRV